MHRERASDEARCFVSVVFLSHSSADKTLARRIAVDLSMSGVSVWFDEWEILVGHSISQRIERGLDDADFVVVLLSGPSVTSGWVQKEWQSRIGDEALSHGVHVLPVLAGVCEIPRLLRDKRYADMRTDYERGFADLLSALQTHATDKRPVSAGARIESGRIVIEQMYPEMPIFTGLINTIEAGCFERSGTGLRAHVQIVASHIAMHEANVELGLDRMTLVSDSYVISTDPTAPTEFRASRDFRLERGRRLTDIRTGRKVALPMTVSGSAATRVSCVVEEGAIVGEFFEEIRYAPHLPMPGISLRGTFRAVVAL